MRIEKGCDIYCFRSIRYFTKTAAIYYRYQIQSIIDNESYKNFGVSIDEYSWLDSDERYTILIRANFDDMKEVASKADFYIEYNAINKKLDHIIDVVGLSERIES